MSFCPIMSIFRFMIYHISYNNISFITTKYIKNEYVNFFDNTKKLLVFINHTHIRLRSTNNTF